MRKSIARTPRQTNVSHREIGPLPWSYLIVLAICGCVLGAGFFLAARQHFASMEFGMKNSALRKQLEDLESENRRLLLAREVSLSPVEITRTARNLGFLEVNTVLSALPANAPANKTVAVIEPIKAASPSLTAVPNRAAVMMTAYQRPSNAVLVEKKRTSEKSKRASDDPKLKLLRPELTAIVRTKQK